MRLGQALLWVIDPASAYMRSQGPSRPRGPAFRGGAAFGPGVEGGARQATDEEREDLRGRHEADGAEDQQRHSSGDLDPEDLRDAVQELAARAETTLRVGATTLTARLITFWHGDAILDIRLTGESIEGSTLARVARERSVDDEDRFAGYIRRALDT
jgi:hypothetical protein